MAHRNSLLKNKLEW